MNIDKIRKQAPQGATHYDIDCDYLRLHKNEWSVWSSFHETWQPIHTPAEETMTRFKIKPL